MGGRPTPTTHGSLLHLPNSAVRATYEEAGRGRGRNVADGAATKGAQMRLRTTPPPAPKPSNNRVGWNDRRHARNTKRPSRGRGPRPFLRIIIPTNNNQHRAGQQAQLANTHITVIVGVLATRRGKARADIAKGRGASIGGTPPPTTQIFSQYSTSSQ